MSHVHDSQAAAVERKTRLAKEVCEENTMSSPHGALYARVALERAEVGARLLSVFNFHSIPFLGSARGLRWDTSENMFVPDADQEREDFDDLKEALAETAEWSCVCFDMRLLNIAFELFLFDSPVPGRGGTNVYLSFPHSLYKFAVHDPVVAARWLGLLAHIGLALDRAAMICGLEVLMISATEDRLLARFEHFLKDAKPGSYVIHSVLTAAPLLTGQLKEKVPAMGFTAFPLAGPYRLWTQLRYDNEILSQAIVAAQTPPSPESA